MKIIVVLPAYNEEANIGAVLQGLANLKKNTADAEIHAVVVDDGSSDQTSTIASAQYQGVEVEVLRNEANRGLAYTFQRGMIAAIERASSSDIIVSMDADNTHAMSSVAGMVHAIGLGSTVVIASRFVDGALVRGVPLLRRILSFGMSLLCRVMCRIPHVRDYSSGYRAFNAAFLTQAYALHGRSLFVGEGFACMVGFILRLHELNARFSEVPIELYYDRKIGASKMPVSRSVRQTLFVLMSRRQLSTHQRLER